MRNKSVYGFLIIVTLVFCLALAPSATAASDEEEIIQVEENFIKALATNDFDLISSLYWHSSKTTQFGPGFLRGSLWKGWDKIGALWEYGLTSSDETSQSTFRSFFQNPEVTMLKDDVAIINGYEMEVTIDPATEEESYTKLRVTRVVQKIGGKWLIVHEHVSSHPTQ